MRPPDNDAGGPPSPRDRPDITTDPPPPNGQVLRSTVAQAGDIVALLRARREASWQRRRLRETSDGGPDDVSVKPQVKGAMGRGPLGMVQTPGFGHDHDTPDLRLYQPVCTENQVFAVRGGNGR